MGCFHSGTHLCLPVNRNVYDARSAAQRARRARERQARNDLGQEQVCPFQTLLLKANLADSSRSRLSPLPRQLTPTPQGHLTTLVSVTGVVFAPALTYGPLGQPANANARSVAQRARRAHERQVRDDQRQGQARAFKLCHSRPI